MGKTRDGSPMDRGTLTWDDRLIVATMVINDFRDLARNLGCTFSSIQVLRPTHTCRPPKLSNGSECFRTVQPADKRSHANRFGVYTRCYLMVSSPANFDGEIAPPFCSLR